MLHVLGISLLSLYSEIIRNRWPHALRRFSITIGGNHQDHDVARSKPLRDSAREAEVDMKEPAVTSYQLCLNTIDKSAVLCPVPYGCNN